MLGHPAAEADCEEENLTMVCKTWQRSARRGTADGTAARSHGAICAPDVHDDARGRRSTLGRGRTCSGSPVLAVLVLGERPEPPLDLSDPALELFDLTTRRPELLHDGLGQALELPLERRHQAHPPSVQLLHRALRLLLDIRAQVPDVDQRENLLNHRLAAAFDQLARVVPQLAHQPLPPPPQPFDRSTNVVQREQPCLFLFHEALLSAADGAVFSGSAQLPGSRSARPNRPTAPPKNGHAGWPAHRDDPRTAKN